MRNKNILKVLSLLAAICITAGCNGSVASETTTTTTAAQITTAMTTEEVMEETDVSEETISPMPEGWSVEKIASLIEIDGNPLKFPCTPEEFESLSEKITLGEPDEYFNYCDIYYDDVNIGTFALNRDSGYCDYIQFDINNFYTTSIVEMITFLDFQINDISNIGNFLDDNFDYTRTYTDEYGTTLRSYEHSDEEQCFVLKIVFTEKNIESLTFLLTEMEGN